MLKAVMDVILIAHKRMAVVERSPYRSQNRVQDGEA